MGIDDYISNRISIVAVYSKQKIDSMDNALNFNSKCRIIRIKSEFIMILTSLACFSLNKL